jgi:hypothetical protein
MNLFDLFPKLAEKRVTLNDLDVPYRIYVNWSEKGSIGNRKVHKAIVLDGTKVFTLGY